MRTRRPRSLIRQDSRDLAFCHLKFRKALSRYIDKRRDEGRRITQTQLCQNLADHLHLSQDSIDNYRKGYNGPASRQRVWGARREILIGKSKAGNRPLGSLSL